MPTITYERCGERIVRLTRCPCCDADVVLGPYAKGSSKRCAVCRKKARAKAEAERRRKAKL